MNPKHAILFEPIAIGPKTMRNRFYQTPHCTNLGSDQPGAQAHFRGMKAEGGWAVVNTEWCSIHPESDDSPRISARLWDSDDVKNLSLMCEEVHRHDALAGVELCYSGAQVSGYMTRLAPRGVSQIPSEAFWMSSCSEMDREEIAELQGFYVDAARRARSAGFDIINIMGAEIQGIPLHFLMNFFNKRTDEYGGRLENRARFWLEVLEQVRAAVGEDCAITSRLCIDSLHPTGVDVGIRLGEEAIGFIELADHLVDFWDLQVGGRVVEEWTDDAGASRFFPENSQGAWLQQVRPYTKKPIVGVGRFTNPDTMVEVIQSGQQDIIGAARPSIADPFLPRKIEEGRLDDIRECIGCNMCLSRTQQAASIICTQNATSGEEYRRRWHPERYVPSKEAESDILVLGAGPAGMECAMILGKRGVRRIHLVEAEKDMGGIMRWIPRLPGLGEWARVVDYRKIQLGKLKNVEFVPDKRLSVEEVREYGADVVVVATGSHWATDGLNAATHSTVGGADAAQPYCLTPEQIMVENKEVTGERIAVYDCDGYFMGVSLAERLALQGKKVSLITPFGQVAPYMVFTGEARHMLRRLHALKVETYASHVITRIERDAIHGEKAVIAGESPMPVLGDLTAPVTWRCDAVVLVTQRVSNDEIYRKLRSDRRELAAAGIVQVLRIGDCVAPRSIADVIFDGHRLAREIDTEDPARPLPFIRERRVLGSSDEDYERVLTMGSG
jgi:dimethylamine/trimethylamine dehydrogenase